MYRVLEKYYDDVDKCVRCGICQASCPTYMASSDESMVARGRMSLIMALLEGKIDITDSFKDRMSSCAICMNCVENCPNGVKAVDIINAARSECYLAGGKNIIPAFMMNMVIENGWPIEYAAAYLNIFLRYIYPALPANGILAKISPFVRNNRKRSIPMPAQTSLRSKLPEIIRPHGKPKARVLFFLGCMTDIVYQQSGISIIETLHRNKIEVVIPKNLYCCGAPVYYTGNRESSINIAEKNSAVINSLDADIVISNCATCGTMLTQVYNLLLKNSGIEKPVMDVHKFLVENTDILEYNSRIVSERVKVTYHDPCHLKRGQGVYEAPRKILISIPWIEFIEMKDADQCCGGAGMFSIKHYDLAMEIAKKKIRNIKETGASIVATGCPSCQMHIADALKREGLNIEVAHTAKLLMIDNCKLKD